MPVVKRKVLRYALAIIRGLKCGSCWCTAGVSGSEEHTPQCLETQQFMDIMKAYESIEPEDPAKRNAAV